MWMKFKSVQTCFSVEETLLALMENWKMPLAGAYCEGRCFYRKHSTVGPLTRPLSGQEPCLMTAKTDSPDSYIKYDIYLPCKCMLYYTGRMGWHAKQIKQERMKTAEILGWLYGCTTGSGIAFLHSHYIARSIWDCFQVCSSWKQGVKLAF